MFYNVITVALLAFSSLTHVAALPELLRKQAANPTCSRDARFKQISSLDPSHTVCATLQRGPSTATETAFRSTVTAATPTAYLTQTRSVTVTVTVANPNVKRQTASPVIPPHMAAYGTTAIASVCSCFSFTNLNFNTLPTTITRTLAIAKTIYPNIVTQSVYVTSTVTTRVAGPATSVRSSSTSVRSSTVVDNPTSRSSSTNNPTVSTTSRGVSNNPTTTSAVPTCTITGFSKRSIGEGVFAFENQYSEWAVL